MITLLALTADELDVAEHLAAVAHPSAGANTVFIGTVRNHDPAASSEVSTLEYTAHPDAEGFLRRIAERFDTPECRIALSHRTGVLRVGDIAIVCAVSAAHRSSVFPLAEALVEAVKAELPMWKRQVETDGAAVWVGLEG